MGSQKAPESLLHKFGRENIFDSNLCTVGHEEKLLRDVEIMAQDTPPLQSSHIYLSKWPTRCQLLRWCAATICAVFAEPYFCSFHEKGKCIGKGWYTTLSYKVFTLDHRITAFHFGQIKLKTLPALPQNLRQVNFFQVYQLSWICSGTLIELSVL